MMIIPKPPDSLESLPEYQKIRITLDRLEQSGVIRMGSGWCISMSDMLYTLLKQQGIQARLVECQLIMTKTDPDSRITYNMVGSGTGHGVDGYVDTHLVVVTKTDPPLVIDSSITHLLDGDGVTVVAEARQQAADRIFCEFTHRIQGSETHFAYQEKILQQVPLVHQSSVIDRIMTDQEIFSNIRTLKRLNYIGIGLSLFAVINVVGKILGVL
jgi:hypothetical protein